MLRCASSGDTHFSTVTGGIFRIMVGSVALCSMLEMFFFHSLFTSSLGFRLFLVKFRLTALEQSKFREFTGLAFNEAP